MSRYLVLVMTNIAWVMIKEFKIPIVFYFAALYMEGCKFFSDRMSCSKEEECFSTFFLVEQGLDFSTYTSSLLLLLF